MFQKGEGGANGNGTISDFFASRDGSKSGMITEFPNEPARLSVPIGSTCEAEAISPLSSSRHSLPQYSSPLRSSPPQSSAPLQSSSRLQSPPPLLVLSDSSDGQEPIRQFKINPSSWITSQASPRHNLSNDGISLDSDDSSSSISIQDDEPLVTIRPNAKHIIQSPPDSVISIEDSEIDGPSQTLVQPESVADTVSIIDSSSGSDSDSLDLNQTCISIHSL